MIKLSEQCGCGAVFSLETVSATHEWTMEQVKEWRTDHHHHDMPEPELEQPLIHESGSSHERAEPFWIGHEIPA